MAVAPAAGHLTFLTNSSGRERNEAMDGHHRLCRVGARGRRERAGHPQMRRQRGRRLPDDALRRRTAGRGTREVAGLRRSPAARWGDRAGAKRVRLDGDRRRSRRPGARTVTGILAGRVPVPHVARARHDRRSGVEHPTVGTSDPHRAQRSASRLARDVDLRPAKRVAHADVRRRPARQHRRRDAGDADREHRKVTARTVVRRSVPPGCRSCAIPRAPALRRCRPRSCRSARARSAN